MPLARLRCGFLRIGKAAETSPASRAYNSQETPQASTPAETFDHLTPYPGLYQIRPADTHTICTALKTLRICEFHHRSSLEWDFSPDLVHLGCIARGLASRQDPSTTLLGALAVTQEAILFHGMYGVCSCGGPAYCDQACDFPSPNSISVDISRKSRYKARIMNCTSLIFGTFKRR